MGQTNTELARTGRPVSAIVSLRSMWEKGQGLTWGVPGSPTPLSQDLTGQHPTQKVQGQNLAKETYSFLQENEKGNQTRNLNRKPDCPLPATGSIQVSPSQRKLLELLIGRRRYYANQGAGLAYKGPRG